MTCHAKVISDGKIVIPAALRREFGIEDGDSSVIERDDSRGLTINTYAQVIREERRKFRAMVGDDYTVDTFLRENPADGGDE